MQYIVNDRPVTIDTAGDIIRVHRGHFFSKDNMRFFKTRVLCDIVHAQGMVYFITSERGPLTDSKRRYTIREYNPITDTILTVGEFNNLTRYKALKALKSIPITQWSK